MLVSKQVVGKRGCGQAEGTLFSAGEDETHD